MANPQATADRPQGDFLFSSEGRVIIDQTTGALTARTWPPTRGANRLLLTANFGDANPETALIALYVQIMDESREVQQGVAFWACIGHVQALTGETTAARVFELPDGNLNLKAIAELSFYWSVTLLVSGGVNAGDIASVLLVGVTYSYVVGLADDFPAIAAGLAAAIQAGGAETAGATGTAILVTNLTANAPLTATDTTTTAATPPLAIGVVPNTPASAVVHANHWRQC